MNAHAHEQEILVDGKLPIAGTLAIPSTETGDERLPAVLILAGTGENDRNGNSRWIQSNMYRDIASFISEQGCISLRYDKRGVGGSKGSFIETGVWDLVDDAEACLLYLREHPRVDPERIVVLGHSEGALLAPLLFERQPCAGLILLAGFAEPSKVAMPRQANMALQELDNMPGFKGKLIRFLGIPKKLKKKNDKVMSQIIEAQKPIIRIQGKRIGTKWYQEHFALDVTQYLPKVTCPVLAVTGSKDVQVLPEHAQVTAELVSGPAEWHIIPGMTHILKHTEENLSILNAMKVYKKLFEQDVPMSPELKRIIADWLHRNIQTKEAAL
jgi:uncharacterized protein